MNETFPIRVAAIDVGSNGIRFQAAEFLQPEHYTTLEQVRTPVRLGQSAFKEGKLDKDTMDAAVNAIVGYAERAATLNIQAIRAVATSAVRDSSNGREFIERVKRETGIRLETISGAEEMRLVHLAVRSRIDLRKGHWVIADLGGGSCETAVVDDKTVRDTVSHAIGTVRLLQELGGSDADEEFEQRVEEYVNAVRLPIRQKAAGFVATGGNIEALSKLAAADADDDGVSVIPLNVLRSIRKRLSRLTFEERVANLDLREDRADVIIPAAIVYERICVKSGVDRIHVPNVGVKDGILLDLVDDMIEHVPHAKRQEQVIASAALAIGKRYGFESPHARQVSRLALSLFDQLAGLHGLGETERRILLAASLLHDVGAFINQEKHHKHSYYIITQTEIPGIDADELEIVAQVARYHRKGEPALHHDPYVDLSAGDRMRVCRLAAILRVADALDREHRQAVRTVEVKIGDDAVILEITGKGDLSLERWALDKKGKMFERIYERALHARRTGSRK
ncbi:MAG: Ppx/GppA phosphatase family protein [Longimicrobiales bacterium]